MDGNYRLRRTRVARGVRDLDMEALRKRQELRMAMKEDGSLSARSSPGSGESTGKSTGNSTDDDDSPDTPNFRPTRPPGKPTVGQPVRLLPPVSVAPSIPPPAAQNPEIVSRTTTAAPTTTEPPSKSLSSITTTAYTVPPPLNNAGDAPSLTKTYSPSSSTDSPTTTSPSSMSTYSTSSTSTTSTSTSPTSKAKTSTIPSSAATTRDPVETATSGVAPPPPPPPSNSSAGSSAATTAASTGPTTMLTMSLPTTAASQPGSTVLPVPALTGTAALSVGSSMGIPTKSAGASSTLRPSETMAPAPLVPVTGSGGSGSGSNSGAMAGITVGTIAGVGMFAALIFFFYKKYKQRQFLDKSYVDGSRDGPGGPKQTSIFNTIQERFHTIAAPVSARIGEIKEKGFGGGNNGQARGVAGGAAAGAAVGGVAGGAAAANVDPKTQSQIINEMFQAAFAAENGMGDRDSTYTSDYSTEKGMYYGQEIPQGSIRESMSKWLRASSINPLQQNPARDSSDTRLTAPSWAQSARSSTTSSMLSEGDGVTSGVNSGLFPPGFRPASPLAPPVPPIPQAANMQSRWSESTRAPPDTPSVPSMPPVPNMQSRWSESTRAPPDTPAVPSMPPVPNMQSRWSASTRAPPDTPAVPSMLQVPNMQSRWSESTRAPPDTPSMSHDSLYSMYNRDTHISGMTDSVVPEVPEWWRNEQQRASSNALGSAVGSGMSYGLPTPSSSASDAHLSLEQPGPELHRGAN
ncbi:hypothetical protein MCOR25_003863 [Pyricularia grisea]|uniref:Uncharacterized protein n=1 Tax=Pyricularia grisea TaxID=148305 RepID=A0A6P8B9C4_PYRGI|nr:uncharacterized protein PgNI_03623 [Pyricularia grisea]KAI6371834.1 hypothetical protein MCOR25_003863 [Pyricularia grisea]TLD12252.1 hypothetical protein PgNI_03623 [Pyricularia grisea]